MECVGEELRRKSCEGGVRERVSGRGRKRELKMEKVFVIFIGTRRYENPGTLPL